MSVKLKILYIHTCIPHYATSFFSLFAASLNVKYVLTNPKIAGDIYKNDTSKSEEIQSLDIKHSGFIRWFMPMKCALNEDFDVLMVSGLDDLSKILSFIPSFFVAKCRGKKMVYDSQYWEWDGEQYAIPFLKKIKRSFVKRFREVFLRKMDCILVYGVKPYQYLVSRKFSKELLINTVDVSSMREVVSKENTIREKFGIRPSDKIILYFGRIIPRKGLNLLIRAFLQQNLSENCTFLIAGSGNKGFIEECQQLTDGSDKIIFTGHVDAMDRFQFFKESDLFVLPCYPLHNAVEPWALSINESMQAQTAVLTTDNAGIACELISEGVNGFMVSSDRINEELGTKLKAVIEDTDLLKTVARNGRNTFEKSLQPHHKVNSFRQAIFNAVG